MGGSNLTALDTTGTKTPFTMTDDTIYTGNLVATNATITNFTVDAIAITTATGLTAFAGGGQASGTLVAADYNVFSTVASNFDSAKLPVATNGRVIIIKNASANILSVFPNTSGTINGLAANLSVDIPAGTELTFTASSTTAWGSPRNLVAVSNTTQTGNLALQATASAGNFQTLITNASQAASRTYTIPDAGASASFVMTQGAQTLVGVKTFTNQPVLSAGSSSADNTTYTAVAKGPLLKQGANGKVGTFVANGSTPVTVNNTSIAITDAIIISLNAVGGTVGVQPHVATITAASGFTVVCTASDTSTYNYAIISNAA